MNAKHTPGPWELLRGGIEVQSETNNHEIHAFVGGIPVPVAEIHRNMHVEHDDPVGEYVMSKAEGLANAALIAAALDLYLFVASKAESGDNEALELLERIHGNAKRD